MHDMLLWWQIQNSFAEFSKHVACEYEIKLALGGTAHRADVWIWGCLKLECNLLAKVALWIRCSVTALQWVRWGKSEIAIWKCRTDRSRRKVDKELWKVTVILIDCVNTSGSFLPQCLCGEVFIFLLNTMKNFIEIKTCRMFQVQS